MVVELLSLVILLASAWVGARHLVRLLKPGTDGEQLPLLIAFGTILIAWCLCCAQLPGYIAEMTAIPLVRMPIIAGLSVIGALALRLTSLSAGSARRRVEPRVGETQTAVASCSIEGTSAGTWSACGQWWSLLSPGVKWGCIVPVAGLNILLAIDALLRPPAGTDGLVYHMPMVVRWLKSGRLGLVPEWYLLCFPGNCELWQLFFAAPRIEPLIQLSLVPVGLLFALVVGGLSRELGASVRGATLAGLFMLACPMVALQMFGSYVDMFAGAFTAGSIYWLVRVRRAQVGGARPTATLLLAGLSIGLAVGAKVICLPWAVGITAAVLIALRRGRWIERRSPLPRGRSAAVGLLVFLVGAAATSGFWYFRNMYQTGWIFYPFQFHIAGRQIGSGRPMDQFNLSDGTTDRGLVCLAYPWFEWKQMGYPYAVDNGLGPAVAVFGVPGLLYLAMGQRRRGPPERWAERIAWAVVIVGLLFYLTIFRPLPRYVLPVWAVMLAAAGLLIDSFLARHPRAGTLLVALVVCLSAAMIGLHPLGTLAGRIRDRALSRSRTYEIPALFDQLAQGTVVLNLGPGEMNYPLLGAGWGNQVIESYMAQAWGLWTAPLSRAQLEARGVEMVYARGSARPPFTSDVTYETVYDDAGDAARLPTSAPTRVYRIIYRDK